MIKFAFILLLLFPATSLLAESNNRLLISSPDQSGECFLDPASVVRVLPNGDLEVAILDEGDDCFFGTAATALTGLILVSDPPLPGDPVTIQWASTSDSPCRATGDLPGWPAADIGTQGPTTAIVSAAAQAGSYEAVVACGQPPNSVERALTIAVGAATRPPAPNLTVTPTAVTQGESFTITWSSTDATSCTASGDLPGWSGAKATSGTQTVATTGATQTGPYSVTLACQNAGGFSDPTTRAVSVTAPSDCGPERSLPADWPRLTTGGSSCLWAPGVGFDGTADCRTWSPGIFPAPFLNSDGLTRRIATNRAANGKGYVAIAISTAGMAPNAQGRIQGTSGGPGIQFSRRLATISSCPGDFNKPAIDQETGCYFALTGVTPNILWGGPTSGRSCRLEPNRTYYLNIIGSDSPVGTNPDQLEPAAVCVDNPNGYRCAAVYSAQ